jgi:hypothetical protein
MLFGGMLMRKAILVLMLIALVAGCTQQAKVPSDQGTFEPVDDGTSEPSVPQTNEDMQNACVDRCGDGNCDEIVCQAEGCPCAETELSCPEDCIAIDIESGITEMELSLHGDEGDCWVVYDSKVYDVTGYLSQHPGGEESISKHCGTLGFEDAFIKKHGTSKVSIMMSKTEEIGPYSG